MIMVSCSASVFSKETVLQNDFIGNFAAVEINEGGNGDNDCYWG